MKDMSNTAANSSSAVLRTALAAALALAALLSASSCGNYEPLPPKTEVATSYYIPAAEAPTQTEIDVMKAERDEYSRLTK